VASGRIKSEDFLEEYRLSNWKLANAAIDKVQPEDRTLIEKTLTDDETGAYWSLIIDTTIYFRPWVWASCTSHH
jgi:hypothetical protein